jgi:hypothetical protein
LEEAAYFGGTTAVSGGGLWIPGNPQAVEAGIEDSLAIARQYVLGLIGETANPALIDAIYTVAPRWSLG